MKLFWIGTGEDLGVEVEADNLTVEQSGALTLWAAPPDSPFQPKLVMAFSAKHWTIAYAITKDMREGKKKEPDGVLVNQTEK